MPSTSECLCSLQDPSLKLTITICTECHFINNWEGWKSKLLSYAGRAIKLNQFKALPSYTLSFVQWSSNLCMKMDQGIRKFWWGHTNSENLCLRSWDHICTPKSNGGLGFRKMKEANVALFSKLAWEVVANKEKLGFNNLEQNIFLGLTISMLERTPLIPSFGKILAPLKKGLCYIIGDGRKVNIWTERSHTPHC